MLDHAAILVVEDEPIIGMALAYAIEDAGGTVVGPVASVKAALALLETQSVKGAILDVNLIDGLISPVVEYLMRHQIPLIVQTGVGVPADLAARFPDLIVRIKPAIADALVMELATLITAIELEATRAADRKCDLC